MGVRRTNTDQTKGFARLSLELQNYLMLFQDVQRLLLILIKNSSWDNMVLNIIHFLNLEHGFNTLRWTDWLITDFLYISIDQCKDHAKSINILDGKQNHHQEDHCSDITRRKRKSDTDSDGGQYDPGAKLSVAKKPRVCFRFPQIKQR